MNEQYYIALGQGLGLGFYVILSYLVVKLIVYFHEDATKRIKGE